MTWNVLPFKDKLRYSELLNHPRHGRKVSAYQSFWTSNDALSIHRKGREIESAEKLTRKNEKQINHQNKPKSQNKLKKRIMPCNGRLACLHQANSNSVSEIMRVFFDNANCVELQSYERQVDMSFTLSRM